MIKEFLKPSNKEEAAKFKKEQKNAFYLGGGTKLNNSGENFNAQAFISLEGLNLNGIRKEGDKIIIGASETIQQIIDSSEISPFFRESCLGISNRNIRNVSTIGGVIGSGKSWSILLTGLMALEGEVETAEEGKIFVEDYVRNEKPDLILNVFIPAGKVNAFQNNQKKTANSRSEITAAVSLNRKGNAVSKAVIVLGGVDKHPVRLTVIENKLKDGSLKNADSVQDAIMDVLVPLTSPKDNGTYLNYIGSVMVADCVGRCMRS